MRWSRNLLIILSSAITLSILITAWINRSGFGLTVSSKRARRSGLRDLTREIENSTLGFQKIFVVNLPRRTDRRDAIVLAASLSNIEFEFIDGVDGATIPDQAIPKSEPYTRMLDASIGSWRAHMNAIQEVVRQDLTSALILEDDLDWDVNIREQLRSFAYSTRALTQPPSSRFGRHADPTYRTSQGTPGRVTEIQYHRLPPTKTPQTSPYGDYWDVLWPGHCGMNFPFSDNTIIPKGRVVQTDHTVPQQQYLWTVGDIKDLKDQYPNHTRVAHHVQMGICSLGYGVTRNSARKLLLELGLKPVNHAFDLLLRDFCEGRGDPNRGYHTCLTSQPSLFSPHLSTGPAKANSDISDHGDGWQTARTEQIRWSVMMNAAALLEGKKPVDQYPDMP
ncbi:hypothetical protein F4780DRAFT_766207 [Xylariomycetidae sp. FL0641]|nr:hypothetical protein F4780DRAFT_766207 [Xylariomycetidae sp. FL0641]